MNAAIFQCDYYSSLIYPSKEEYWDTINRNLVSFSASLPAFSRVPLLLIFWPTLLFSEKEFSLGVSALTGLRGFKEVETLALNVTTELFDSQLASSSLNEKIIWLLDNSSVEPALQIDILSSMDKETKKFEWAVKRIGQALKSPLDTIPRITSMAFQAMINLYNAFISQVAEILLDQYLLGIPFPADEFGIHPLNWNTFDSYRYFKETVENSYLPLCELDYLSEPDSKQVADLFIDYIETLHNLPGSNEATLYHLKKILINSRGNSLG